MGTNNKNRSKDFSKALKDSGLDKKEFIKMSGVAYSTFRSWESGTIPGEIVFSFLTLYAKFNKIKKFVGEI